MKFFFISLLFKIYNIIKNFILSLISALNSFKKLFFKNRRKGKTPTTKNEYNLTCYHIDNFTSSSFPSNQLDRYFKNIEFTNERYIILDIIILKCLHNNNTINDILNDPILVFPTIPLDLFSDKIIIMLKMEVTKYVHNNIHKFESLNHKNLDIIFIHKFISENDFITKFKENI